MKKRHILSPLPYLERGGIWGLILSSFFCTSPHAATTAHHTFLPGDDLDLSVPCTQAHLKVDPTLKTGVALDENVGSALTIQNVKDGAEDQLHISLRECLSTNRLNLRLSPGTALTLHDSPHATVTITGTLSTLDTSLTDTTLHLDHIQSLDLSMHGASVVQIHQLDRAAQVVATDQSQLMIDQAFLSAFSGQLTGSSQLTITQGQIDNLTLSIAHQAVAHVLAHTGTATVSTNDNAVLTLGQVSGPLNHSGSGQIHQMEVPATPPSPSTPPVPSHGDVTDGTAQGLSNPALTLPSQTPPAIHHNEGHLPHPNHPAAATTGVPHKSQSPSTP